MQTKCKYNCINTYRHWLYWILPGWSPQARISQRIHYRVHLQHETQSACYANLMSVHDTDDSLSTSLKSRSVRYPAWHHTRLWMTSHKTRPHPGYQGSVCAYGHSFRTSLVFSMYKCPTRRYLTDILASLCMPTVMCKSRSIAPTPVHNQASLNVGRWEQTGNKISRSVLKIKQVWKLKIHSIM